MSAHKKAQLKRRNDSVNDEAKRELLVLQGTMEALENELDLLNGRVVPRTRELQKLLKEATLKKMRLESGLEQFNKAQA